MDDVTTLNREETPLQPQRGIATRDGLPIAIQVQFSGGDYPDRLLADGSIEHIGEGTAGEQRAWRGNAAMLKAIEERVAFPVYEKVGNKRYRLLGKYVALEQRYTFLDPANKPDWRGYIFTLKPVWQPAEAIPGWNKPPTAEKAPRQQDAEQRALVELAAMHAVQLVFEDRGFEIKFVHKDNLGWDMEARNAQQTLHLEVKGLSGRSLTVELTPNEFSKMKTLTSYRVCIVNEALKEPKVHVFQLNNAMNRLVGEDGQALEVLVQEGAILKAALGLASDLGV